MRFVRYETVKALQQNALANGGHVLLDERGKPVSEVTAFAYTPAAVAWRISGGCKNPQQRVIRGREEKKTRGLNVQRHASLHLLVRCRRCDNCFRVRRWEWTHRAKIELASAPRTWFCSFTMRPEEHAKATFRIRQRYLDRFPSETSHPANSLGFRERVDDMGRELTLYFKRLRKSTGVSLRYLLVAEQHTEQLAGLPHFHAFIHETELNDLKYRDIREHWGLGFCDAKLVARDDPKAVWYVTKYISKENGSNRIRASILYGDLEEARRRTPSRASVANAEREAPSHSMEEIPFLSVSAPALHRKKPKN